LNRSFAASGFNAARGNWNGARGNWNGARGNWSGARGNWHGGHEWDNYFNRGFVGGWGWGGGYDGYSPWFAGWDWGWGYPYAYSLYGSYPDTGYYPTVNYYSDTGNYPYVAGYYPNDADDYSYSYPPETSYSTANVAADSGAAAPLAPQAAPPIAEGQSGASDALQYYSEAREDFLQGDYQNALRLAGHAELEAPTNPKVHELLSLALFALGKYGPAASEAHAAMAMGPVAQWQDLYGYYNDVNKYTTQLRALEAAAMANPASSADQFLLGYHYLMIGARANAESRFAAAAKLSPGDTLAGQYLKQLRSNAPLTAPQIAPAPRGQQL
jgi:Flp pilus assembly protein TadD